MVDNNRKQFTVDDAPTVFETHRREKDSKVQFCSLFKVQNFIFLINFVIMSFEFSCCQTSVLSYHAFKHYFQQENIWSPKFVFGYLSFTYHTSIQISYYHRPKYYFAGAISSDNVGHGFQNFHLYLSCCLFSDPWQLCFEKAWRSN